MLTLERVANGYDLSFSWQNLTSTNTITHSTTILTNDADPSAAQAAGVTSWDRLGFFINDNSLDATTGPYEYALSNVSVTGNAAALALSSSWTPSSYQIPEPSSSLLMLCGVAFGALRRKRQ